MNEEIKAYRKIEDDYLTLDGEDPFPTVKSELSKGIDIEKEHGDTIKFIKDYYKKNGKFPPDEEVFKNIAQDHLDEFKNYYSELQKMEANLKSELDPMTRYLKNVEEHILKRLELEDGRL